MSEKFMTFLSGSSEGKVFNYRFAYCQLSIIVIFVGESLTNLTGHLEGFENKNYHLKFVINLSPKVN